MQPTFFPPFFTETKSCSRLLDQKSKKKPFFFLKKSPFERLNFPLEKKTKSGNVGVHKAVLVGGIWGLENNTLRLYTKQ